MKTTYRMNIIRNSIKGAAVLFCAALVMSGCQRELLPEGDVNFGDGQIRYSVVTVGLKSTAAVTRSVGSLSLVGGDGKLAVPVTCEVSEGIDLGSGSAATKGALINTTGSDSALPADLGFTVSAYKGSTPQFTTQTAAKRGDYWTMDPPQYWPLSTKLTFYAYTNAGDNTVSQTATSQTLTYTVKEDVTAHKDLMLGYYKGNGGNKGIAEMHFDHPLTAVRFKKGEMTGVTGIKSITLSGLASGGTVAMDADGEIGNWTLASTEKYETAATLSGGETALGVEESSNLIGTDSEGKYNGAFLLIPQTLSDHDVTVTAVLSTESGDDVTVKAYITSGTWQAGMTNTYTLGYNVEDPELLPGKFSVSPTVYVQFSRGNLLATRSSSSSDDWKLGFFENQYDYGTYSTGSVFTANDTEMSLFTFGFDSKATSFNPIGQATGSEDWGNEYNRQYSLPSGTWQTLTGGNNGEWWYLLEGRPNAANLRVFKTVHGHSNCLIILPDGFDLSVPEDDPLTNEQWSDLEAKGAVCLPQAGIRNTLTYGTSSNGYWANNSYGASNAYGVFFSGPTTVLSQGGGCSNYGYSVRLVQKFDWPEVEVTFVDLGLPSGTLWADVNVGAVSKTGVGSYGKYYAWGETAAYLEPMTGYGSWAGAKNANYVEGVIKQHANNNYWKWQFPYGSTAKYKSKDLMLPEDDIATQKYGDGCHIPTMDQWYELFNDEYCTWTWDATKNGHIVTSVKYSGRSIFIPQAGYYKESGYFTYDGTMARFWSSDYWNSISQNCVYINPDQGIKSGSGLSDYGNVLTIRAVKKRPVEYVEIGGLKWATENLAITESGKKEWKGTGHIVGDYFQWGAYAGYCGDVTDVDKGLVLYESFTCKGCGDTADTFTMKVGKKFNSAFAPFNKGTTPYSYLGYVATPATLASEHDAANIVLGGKWRMPTTGEIVAMRNATYWVWDDTDKGYYICSPSGTCEAGGQGNAFPTGTDKTDALLFIPASGYAKYGSEIGNRLFQSTIVSDIWTSSLNEQTNNAYNLYFGGTGADPIGILPGYNNSRYMGFSIRPVADK